MTYRVRFHAHACIAVEGASETLLTDPWLFGDVFNGAWSLLPAPDLDTLDLARVRSIWISHEHPDHLHWPSLAFIRQRVSGRLRVFCSRRRDASVRERLVKLGFEVVELEPHRETMLADGVSGTLFTGGDDSALAMRFGSRVVLNQNDCPLAPGELELVRRTFPRLDAWFCQFSLGGYYANPDDPTGLRAAQRHHIRRVARYFAALRPATFVPFASFFYFSKAANAFLNDWRVTPARLVAALPNLPTQILCPGDVLLWERWTERNATNLARWQAIGERPKTIKPHAAIDEGAILTAGRSLVQHAVARGIHRYGPGETHLAIRESGHAVAIDFRSGAVHLLDRADERRVAIAAPADEILYFLESPYGAGVFFGSCFRVANRGRWRRLRRFRAALHAPTVVSRAGLLGSSFGDFDRRYLGGSLTWWFERLTGRDR